MIRPTRANREWLHERSELIFAFLAPALVVLIFCLAIAPAIAAVFTRCPA